MPLHHLESSTPHTSNGSTPATNPWALNHCTPENPFPQSTFHDAHNQCLTLRRLEAEADASRRVPCVEGCPLPMVCARLLGHLLRLAPVGNSQGQLQREIASADSDHAKLMRLATLYLQNFICALSGYFCCPFDHSIILTGLSTVKRSGGPTAAPSEHPSRPSFKDARVYYASPATEECKISLSHRSARRTSCPANGSMKLIPRRGRCSAPTRNRRMVGLLFVKEKVRVTEFRSTHSRSDWALGSRVRREPH